MRIFLTGGTGLVGHALTERLLMQPDVELDVLVRDRGGRSAMERFGEWLNAHPAARGRAMPVVGDLSHPRFGLDEAPWQALAARTQAIAHVGASVDLTASLAAARRTNVVGTETVIELAQAARRHRGDVVLHHVSTAYVAGQRTGAIRAPELFRGVRFTNGYEQSKHEAEQRVRESGLPAAIYRPSIVVGDSQTGWTNAFNVIYAPIRLCYLGRLPIYPATDEPTLDIVPVDYVADALAFGILHPDAVRGHTFHLAAGRGASVSSRQLARWVASHLEQLVDEHGLRNPRRFRPVPVPVPVFRAGAWLRRRQGGDTRFLDTFATFLDYLAYPKVFDTTSSQEVFGAHGIRPPRLEDYLEVLCRYAVDTHFGRSTTPRHVDVAARTRGRSERRWKLTG